MTNTGGSERTLVLCVDDETTPLILRKLVLERADFRVLTASNGNQALEILSETPVEMVVCDHLMPEMTGAALAARVKARWPQLPFLLLSGVNEIPPGAEIADAFMSKLEGPDAMLNKVRSLLGRSI